MEPNIYATNTVHVDANTVVYSDLCGLQVISAYAEALLLILVNLYDLVDNYNSTFPELKLKDGNRYKIPETSKSWI